ncbi:MAG TPA: hypothetical protein VFB63_10315 [Bryobacteraceae bacterium]|nr:hypothetical protein [Bryobacteraceae bacterium]
MRRRTLLEGRLPPAQLVYAAMPGGHLQRSTHCTEEAVGIMSLGQSANHRRAACLKVTLITNLIHSQLSRTGDGPLLERADDLRLVLLGQGWIELRANNTAH